MAQLTGAEFISKWHGLFADNITRNISEQDLRDFTTDIKDSFFNSRDFVAPAASFASLTGNATDNASIVQLSQDIINIIKGGVAPEYDNLKKLYDFIVEQIGLVNAVAIDGGTPAARVKSIRVRGGTYAQWTAANPILQAREPGLVTDYKTVIYGDGVKSFNTLWAEKDATSGGASKYFVSEAALNAAYPPAAPERKPGEWALVQGATAVTVWTWNPTTSLWEDTFNEVVITVDTALSPTSGNPVANSVITNEFTKYLLEDGTIEIPQVNGLPAALDAKVDPSEIYGLISSILQQGAGIQLIKNGATIVIKSLAGPSGTTDYNALNNKPQINGVELIGNVLSSALGINYSDLVGAPPVGDEEYTEYANLAAFPVTGTADVLYLAKDTKLLYSWNGTIYENVGGGNVPNASQTVAGKVEQATSAQFDAGTDTGETGAPLFVIPSLIKSKLDIAITARAIWEFQNILSTPVPDGKVRFNNASIPSITQMMVAQQSDDITDAGYLFASLLPGDVVFIQQKNDAAKWARFQITAALTDNGTWWTFPISLIDTSGTLPGTNTKVILRFTETNGGGALATETVKGVVEEGTQAQVNDSANTGTGETGARLFVSIPKLWAWWTFILSQAWTWAAKQTFTTAPRFSSTTASKILKVDANKDLTSGDVALSDLGTQPALTVIANATNAVAAATPVAATVSERILARTASNTLAFVQATTNMILDGAITTLKILDNAVTNVKLAQMPGMTVKSNFTGATNNASDYPAINIYNYKQQAYTYDLDGLTQTLVGSIYGHIANRAVVNTVTPSDILGQTLDTDYIGTKIIPGHNMVIGKVFRMTLRGYLTTSGAPTLRLQVLLGATSIIDTAIASLVSVVSNGAFELFCTGCCRSKGATGTIFGHGEFEYYSAPTTKNYIQIVNTTAATIDTTIDQTFAVVATWGTAHALNNLVVTGGVIEILN